MRTPHQVIPAPTGWRYVVKFDERPDSELLIFNIIAWAVFTAESDSEQATIEPLTDVGDGIDVPSGQGFFGTYAPDEWMPDNVLERLGETERQIEVARRHRLTHAQES